MKSTIPLILKTAFSTNLVNCHYNIMHNKAFSWKKKSPEIERQPAYVCAFVRAIVHAHR